MSAYEAIQYLSNTVGEALYLFGNLQSSFISETAHLIYLDDKLMDYIWHDKLKFIERNCSGHGDRTAPRSLVKRICGGLNDAIEATVYETHQSKGDGTTLAEKLTRMARDVDNSRDMAFRERKQMDALVTDLEMLHVLLKRHVGGGGRRGSKEEIVEGRMIMNGGGSDSGDGAQSSSTGERMRIMPSRTSSYERPRVEDEHDHGNDGHESDSGGTTVDGGFQDAEGAPIAANPPNSPKIIQIPTPSEKLKAEDAASDWGGPGLSFARVQKVVADVVAATLEKPNREW
ncbi:uncharacterized protein KY384_002379 [Bacidia gigantensis]|uniref:uncharacterized protein n=1 Tax=Bacidia gigantensis TaxID=2732470 RepID=UPI001D03A90C|nr:uncharacterized protein KY384_002379 [Bacidia gigantensis]KAG8532502.1 hypothetical protein KY384_002379 [Bacidia gigantensis]